MDEDTLEPWLDWIKRVTRESDNILKDLNLEDWLTTWRRRIWSFAGKLARESTHKWSWKVLAWDPNNNQRNLTHRRHARPRKRWTSDIERHAGFAWTEIAQNKNQWAEMGELFAKHD
eukprot:5811291-Karenia_brevis.AAC.1